MDENASDIPLTSIEQFNALGEAPIHIAAWKAGAGEVKWLLANGAEVNQRVVCGLTPLHYAYVGGKPENIEALLSAGADPTARTDMGLLPAAGSTAEALEAERSVRLYGY